MFIYELVEWLDLNYEKIWLIVMGLTALFFALGLISGNDIIYGMSEDIADFYDEVLCE